jgi:putative ABC transport system substrate-binding protein
MKRRDFIALLGGAAIAWPITARGQQQAGKVRRIGVFAPGSVQTHGQYVTAFRNKLNTLGYAEGTDRFVGLLGRTDWSATSISKWPSRLKPALGRRLPIPLIHRKRAQI